MENIGLPETKLLFLKFENCNSFDEINRIIKFEKDKVRDKPKLTPYFEDLEYIEKGFNENLISNTDNLNYSTYLNENIRRIIIKIKLLSH
jgi:hypothetical protein